jgi:tetratricopeptide (TPR) repeat protein
MASDVIDWDEDLAADPDEDYQTFVRTLRRTDGFRLLFVQCTPAEGEDLIARVKKNIPQKRIEFLQLHEPIDNLYKIVECLPNRNEINILFIQGLEHSFYDYEKLQFGNNTKHNYYSWEGVPPILNHLNQQRERFRDDFNICFVFLLRSFAFKYFIHRSPDFFDWRSGVFEFPTKQELLEQESSRILQEGDYDKYCSLTPEEQVKKVLEIQELLAENHQQPSDSEAVASRRASRARLQLELGNLLLAAKEYEAAVASYDQALKIKPDLHQAWNNRGIALLNLGRFEEAFASYDQALQFKPDYHEAWNNRGIALLNLGRFEEAVASYDQALKIKPDLHQAWYNRGVALRNLGRLEEAVASYDQALKIKPDLHQAWYNRGYALDDLGRLEEAVASYDQALKIKPDYHEAWYSRGYALDDLGRLEEAVASYDQALQFKPDYHEAWNGRGNALFNLGRLEEAVASYDQALKIKPDYYEAWNNRGYALDDLGRLEEAVASYDQALKIKPDYHDAWNNRGVALWNLGRLEEAFASYDQALKFKPDLHQAWYNKACSYALQGNVEQAIENLQQAINLSPDEYREMAKTDSDFDKIREDERFRALIQEPLPDG